MSEPRQSQPPRAVEIALLAIVVLALAASLYVWRDELWNLVGWLLAGDHERIRDWAATLGALGPLVTVTLNVAQVLLAPIPGQFVGITNGYLYGVWLGTLYSMVGLLVGTVLAMVLSRRFGRPFVRKLARPGQLERWDGIAQRRGPLFFFLVFLVPSLPDDLLCFLIGLSPLDIPRMVVLAMIGRLPGVFVSCWLGAYASSLPPLAWVPMAAAAVLLAWFFWRYQQRLEAAGTRLVQWITARREASGPE